MKYQPIIGMTWALLFGALAAFMTHELVSIALRSEFGWKSGFYEPSWWLTQGLAIAAVSGCAVTGLGLLLRRAWGKAGIRILGPLVLLYLLAYIVFGGERAWWVSLGALALTAFVAASVFFAYRRSPYDAA